MPSWIKHTEYHTSRHLRFQEENPCHPGENPCQNHFKVPFIIPWICTAEPLHYLTDRISPFPTEQTARCDNTRIGSFQIRHRPFRSLPFSSWREIDCSSNDLLLACVASCFPLNPINWLTCRGKSQWPEKSHWLPEAGGTGTSKKFPQKEQEVESRQFHSYSLKSLSASEGIAIGLAYSAPYSQNTGMK